MTAESSLILTNIIETILGIIVDEWINFIDIQSNNWNGREIISEDVTLYDIAGFAKIYGKDSKVDRTGNDPAARLRYMDGEGAADTPMVFVAIILLTLIGIVAYLAVIWIERRVLHYIPARVHTAELI